MAKRRDVVPRVPVAQSPGTVEPTVPQQLPLRLAGIDLRALECHVDTDGGKAPTEKLNLKTEAMLQIGDGHKKIRVVFIFSATLPDDAPNLPPMPFLVRATYHVRYDVTAAEGEIDEASLPALYEVTQKTALVNVWPFWRELVATMTTRMNMPRIMIPLLDTGAVATGHLALLGQPKEEESVNQMRLKSEIKKKTKRKK